jgi:hypothetical protein
MPENESPKLNYGFFSNSFAAARPLTYETVHMVVPFTKG